MDELQKLGENPKLMKLAKFAMDLAEVTLIPSLTADEAMDQILNTPQLPPELPENFIYKEAYEKCAEALNKPWTDLTETERQHAILNAILVEDHIDG